MPPKIAKQGPKLQKPEPNQDSGQQANTPEHELTPDATTMANASEIVPTSVLLSMQEDFGKRFDRMLTEIKAVRCDIKLMAARVTLAEERIGANEDAIATMKAANEAMKVELATLTNKVDELENHGRRSNVRLVGLPENTEGNDMCLFLSKWIPEVLGTETFPVSLSIERAHRIGRPRDSDSTNPARPREIIMKFLNFADKVRIMKVASQKGTLFYEGKKVMLFQDFSVELRRKRRLFDPVKKQLAALHIPDLRYGVVYPAKLLITHRGRRHVFDNPADADLFTQRLKANENQEENTT